MVLSTTVESSSTVTSGSSEERYCLHPAVVKSGVERAMETCKQHPVLCLVLHQSGAQLGGGILHPVPLVDDDVTVTKPPKPLLILHYQLRQRHSLIRTLQGIGSPPNSPRPCFHPPPPPSSNPPLPSSNPRLQGTRLVCGQQDVESKALPIEAAVSLFHKLSLKDVLPGREGRGKGEGEERGGQCEEGSVEAEVALILERGGRDGRGEGEGDVEVKEV